MHAPSEQELGPSTKNVVLSQGVWMLVKSPQMVKFPIDTHNLINYHTYVGEGLLVVTIRKLLRPKVDECPGTAMEGASRTTPR